MPQKPPTYRERAIDTSVNNTAGMRDLLIDLAAEIDKLVPIPEPPSTFEPEQNPNQTKKEE